MSYFVSILVILGVILVSMMLHELAHGYVAYLLGDNTAKDEGRLTLNPLKHLDPVLSVAMPLLLFLSGGPVFGGAKPVPVDSRKLKHGVWGMAMVALAGPLTNFVLAFGGFLIGYFTGAFSLGMYGSFYQELMTSFVVVNLGFGVFNLIPIPPLDGSRVLYALAPDQVREVMKGMERWGIMVILILVVIFSSAVSAIMSGAINGIWQAFFWLVGAGK